VRAPKLLAAVAVAIALAGCKPATQAHKATPSLSVPAATASVALSSPVPVLPGTPTPTATPDVEAPAATQAVTSTATVSATTAALPSVLYVAGSTLTGTAPAPGTCHARTAADGQPLPDVHCTPGAIDAAVAQANIHTTICIVGYTTTVRPSVSQTDAFKVKDELAYSISSGELDHLVPLEIGGSSDAHNLWVEPGSIPNPKDAVENTLHAKVCAGQMTLAAAQLAIATDWTTFLTAAPVAPTTLPAAPSPTKSPIPTTAALSCTASVSNGSPHHGQTVDVLVHTAAGAQITVTAHYKSKDTVHDGAADVSGHADVPFDIATATYGFTVDVDVAVSAGARTMTCSTSFTPAA